jgi:fatty acid desaturase
MMRMWSWAHLVRVARKNRAVSLALAADVVCLLAHYTLWLVIPSLIWGVVPTLVVYIALWKIVGISLALIFAPAHMGLPVIIDQNNDWEHQLETTRNLRLPRFLRFFFVGLDYQIEHHLFPKIPHQALPRAAAITEAWCRRVGVPHMEIGYRDAVVEVTRFMRDAWKIPASTGAEVRGGRWVDQAA